MQGLAERSKDLRDRTAALLAGVNGATMMVVMSVGRARRLLRILLDRGEVLLGGREIARLQVLPEGLERLRDAAGARGRASLLLGARKLLRQGGKILLRLA